MMQWLKKLHKWVGLLIGIQVFLWLLSGLMMSLLNPEKVSGQQWSREVTQETQTLPPGELLNLDELPATQLADAQNIRLTMHQGQPVYRVKRVDSVTLINATDGSVIAYDKADAEKLASDDYSGAGEITSVVSGSAPDMETRNHSGPYWRVNFSDDVSTSLYISASTGDILERRNSYWRVFDVFWMLHIMDYVARVDFNNALIIIVALITIWLGISGFILLFGSFRWRDFNFAGKLRQRDEVLVTLIDPAISTPQQVKLRHGGNLFLSLAANNVTLPSNCGGGGSCGLCLVQLESAGLSVPNAAEKSHIPQHLLDKGYRLACQHEVVHSITLRLTEGTIAARTIRATVQKTRSLTPYIKEILLTSENPLVYAAGSFFQVNIPPHDGCDTPIRRAYSAANYAGEIDSGLLLNVRFQPAPADKPEVPAGTGSAWLHSLQEGDTVNLSGPYGHFHAQDTQREMVFIGGGAGMGPLRAIILDQLVNRSSHRRISYWYGARNQNELFYADTFDQLALEHDNFNWHVALSDVEPDSQWQGSSGFIHQVVLDNYLANHANINDCEFYICGPPAMLMATLEMLAELGVSADAIRYDDFGN